MNNSRVEVMLFRHSLAAGASIKLSERIKADCTIEGLRMRFYAGPENTLRVRPCLWQTGRNMLVDLITYPDKTSQYITGDDDAFEYPITLDALKDDEVWLFCENTGDYDYLVNTDVIIDYYVGTNRVIGGLI